MEMEVFKKWFHKGFRPILGFVPNARMERGHILWAAGLVGTLRAAVETIHPALGQNKAGKCCAE